MQMIMTIIFSSDKTDEMNNSTSDPLVDLSKKISLYGNILILIIGNASNIIKIVFFSSIFTSFEFLFLLYPCWNIC